MACRGNSNLFDRGNARTWNGPTPRAIRISRPALKGNAAASRKTEFSNPLNVGYAPGIQRENVAKGIENIPPRLSHATLQKQRVGIRGFRKT